MSESTHAPAGNGAPLRACENCGTALRGGYCHVCGQPEASPVRHVGHAVEEVFESFWHLDGRIFRTLRWIWVPGRIANEYLAGHRVRYVAPMRLFVILTALTFFVAQFLVPAGGGAPAGAEPSRFGVEVGAAVQLIEAAETVEEVEAVREEWLTGLAEVQAQLPPFMPGLDAPMVSAMNAIQRAADARIAALGGPAGDRPVEPAPAEEDAPQAASGDAPAKAAGEPGHPEEMERLGRSVERLANDPGGYLRDLLGAAPMAMFITVPLFAAMLKLAYLFCNRLYLEHLVVALYSHAWMMLVLLVYFALVLAGGWLAPHAPWALTPLAWLRGLALAAIPLYLLWMQKRVYAQSWPMTLWKFALVGLAYLILLVTTAALVAVYVILTF